MPAAKKPAAKAAPKRAPRASTQKWIRNLYTLPLPIRMTDKSELKLQARGQRGDMMFVSKTQLEDPKLQSNIGLSVELISDAEAKKILKGQLTNAQAPAPDHILSFIRNPMDNNESYEQETVVVDHSRTDPGDTVAMVGPDGNVYRTVQQGVGPRVAVGVPGGDNEFAQLLGADEAAKNGDSLEDVLRGFSVE